jgi:hypothetical protein
MKALIFVRRLSLFAAALILLSCNNSFNNNDNNDNIVPAAYKDFYNYPTGRVDQYGYLTIENAATSKALLFTDSVEPENYIGTVERLGKVTVKLPIEKFYTIVAVDEASYEEKGVAAYQYSDLSYYSHTQRYTVSVNPSDLFGAGTWILSNYSEYWVALQKADKSGNWAVLGPGAIRTEVPIPLETPFDYIPHYYKELKYDGKVISLVEYDNVPGADTVFVTREQPTFNTSINKDIAMPTENLNPAVLFTNACDKTVRMYYGEHNLLSPKGTPEDYAVPSGSTVMITSGIVAGTANTKNINFDSIAWTTGREYVNVDKFMQKGYVYQIALDGNASIGYTTTVTEESSEEFFK